MGSISILLGVKDTNVEASTISSKSLVDFCGGGNWEDEIMGVVNLKWPFFGFLFVIGTH